MSRIEMEIIHSRRPNHKYSQGYLEGGGAGARATALLLSSFLRTQVKMASQKPVLSDSNNKGPLHWY